MASAQGYRYSTARHWEVLKTGRKLREVMERWNPALCGPGNDASLPSFPQNFANQAILRQLVAMLQLLDPVKHGWPSIEPPLLTPLWNEEVQVAYAWISNTFGNWIDQWGLRRHLDNEVGRPDRRGFPLDEDCANGSVIGTLEMPIKREEVEAWSAALDTLERELEKVGSSVNPYPLGQSLPKEFGHVDEETKAKTSAPSSPQSAQAAENAKGQPKLKPCELLAKQSYDYALEQESGLKETTFKSIYKWLIANECPTYGDQELPEFETWDRQRRTAFTKLGLPSRHTLRDDRQFGPSIVQKNRL